MVPVRTSRLTLVAALVVLGLSLGVFTVAVGGATLTTGYQIHLEDEALVVTEGDDRTVLLDDVGSARSITVTAHDRFVVVQTRHSSQASLTTRQKATAKRILARSGLDRPGTASERIYSFSSVPPGMSAQRAAAAVARPDRGLGAVWTVNRSALVANETAADTLKLRRSWLQNASRVLVTVEAVGTERRLGVVVDLEEEAVRAIARFEQPGNRPSPGNRQPIRESMGT